MQQAFKPKLDILAFGAHPDDVDACAGGLVATCVKGGMKAGIIDLTSGDNSETAFGMEREEEAKQAAKVLGVGIRENLNLPERGLEATLENENKLVEVIRNYRPEIVVLPHWHDRHKGHRDASNLLDRAVQTAKYTKVLPDSPAHKVRLVIYYMIHYEFEPTFIFDISKTHVLKMKALFCHKSQLFRKDNRGKYTQNLIDPDFMEAWVARSRWHGFTIGVKYGEAYVMRRPVGIRSLSSLTNLYR